MRASEDGVPAAPAPRRGLSQWLVGGLVGIVAVAAAGGTAAWFLLGAQPEEVRVQSVHAIDGESAIVLLEIEGLTAQPRYRLGRINRDADLMAWSEALYHGHAARNGIEAGIDVAGELVVIRDERGGTLHVEGFDLTTGGSLWFDRSPLPAERSTCRRTLSGTTNFVFVSAGSDRLRVLERSSGDEVWVAEGRGVGCEVRAWDEHWLAAGTPDHRQLFDLKNRRELDVELGGDAWCVIDDEVFWLEGRVLHRTVLPAGTTEDLATLELDGERTVVPRSCGWIDDRLVIGTTLPSHPSPRLAFFGVERATGRMAWTLDLGLAPMTSIEEHSGDDPGQWPWNGPLTPYLYALVYDGDIYDDQHRLVTIDPRTGKTRSTSDRQHVSTTWRWRAGSTHYFLTEDSNDPRQSHGTDLFAIDGETGGRQGGVAGQGLRITPSSSTPTHVWAWDGTWTTVDALRIVLLDAELKAARSWNEDIVTSYALTGWLPPEK